MGDLKLVERLQQYTLAPGASKVIRANIKVRGSGDPRQRCTACLNSEQPHPLIALAAQLHLRRRWRQRASSPLIGPSPPSPPPQTPPKVSSTETGVIFGNIVYEGGGMAERGVVVLADIHIDIMDYIAPASCADVAFRNMWAEFEWENKVRAGAGGGVATCG